MGLIYQPDMPRVQESSGEAQNERVSSYRVAPPLRVKQSAAAEKRTLDRKLSCSVGAATAPWTGWDRDDG